MALEDITKRILNDAKKEANKMIKKAQAEYEKSLEEEKVLLKEEEKESKSKAKEEAHEEVKRRIALARLEARNKVLQEQQDLLEGVFTKALKKLRNLSDSEYKKVIKKIATEKYIPETDYIIVSKELKSKSLDKFISDLNTAIKRKGKGLKVSKEVLPERAGFILKGKEMEVNCTWDVIINSLKEEYSKKVFQILFGEGK